MEIGIISRLCQIKYFWSSLLFGPEQKLSCIEKQTDYRTSKTEILSWLEILFPIPQKYWVQVKASKNPHSEIFIFQQSEYAGIAKKIFIKRFIVHEGKAYSEGLKRECNAIDKFSQFNGTYDVYTPQLYAFNEKILCMAISYLEGNSFFNEMFESPIKVKFGNSRLEDYKRSLFNLGRWLRHIHNSRIMLLESDREKKIDDILKKDIRGIKLRIEHLNKARPADFTSDVCEKITSKSSEMRNQILMNSPSLQTVHGDFSLANILYEEGKLHVLDFSYSGPGLPEHDLARLYLDLQNVESYCHMVTPQRKGSLLSSFFSGYGKEININSLGVCEKFYILKHSIINIYMYTRLWGNRRFLNPFLCRLFYHYQKKILFSLIK